MCSPSNRNLKIEAEKINFAQILSHCSGLPAWRMVYKDCGEIPPCVVSVDEVEIRRERAKQILQTYDFFNEPNSDVIYSDIGFIWLGFAISAICGNQTFDKCLEELVFRPLHLSVYFNPLSSLGFFSFHIFKTNSQTKMKLKSKILHQLNSVNGGKED